jgi:hypothetical protein
VAHPFQSVVYIQIRRQWVGIQILTWSGNLTEWSGTPEALIVPDTRGIRHAFAVDDPRVKDYSLYRPFVAFSHPRVLIDRFDETEKTLALCLRKAGFRRASMFPKCVIHVKDEWLGGVSDLELRALMELSRSLGTKLPLVVTSSRDFTVPEVLAIARRKYPPNTVMVPSELL